MSEYKEVCLALLQALDEPNSAIRVGQVAVAIEQLRKLALQQQD